MMKWSRTEQLRNKTPFPLRLQQLHALVIEGSRTVVYSWDLGGVTVPPQAKMRFALDQLPGQLDASAKRIWVRYSLDRSCETCIAGAIDQMLSGDVWPDTTRVTLRSLTPLADSGAVEMWIKTRSRYFQAGSQTLADGPVLTFTEDRSEQMLEPLFGSATSDAAADAPPLFEYRVTLIMPDGAERAGSNWIAVRDNRVLIGKVQVDRSLGIPAEPTPPP
jgi:hypothetical protein